MVVRVRGLRVRAEGESVLLYRGPLGAVGGGGFGSDSTE